MFRMALTCQHVKQIKLCEFGSVIYVAQLLYNLPFIFLKDARIFAEENDLFFVETSAKTGMGVPDVFMSVGEYPSL